MINKRLKAHVKRKAQFAIDLSVKRDRKPEVIKSGLNLKVTFLRG